MLQAIFSVESLAYGTPAGRVLQKDLTFEVNSGQMLLITGSNGCGKSTLLRTLLGQLPAMSGNVIQVVDNGKIEYIPQLENTEIHLPLTLNDVLNISEKRSVQYEEIAGFRLLNRSLLESAWNTASGGERKRTLLTRALLRKPEVMVFDEPMNHLDEESRRDMIRIMADFLSQGLKERRAILMVCHQGLDPQEESLFDVIRLDLDRRKGNLAC